MRVCKSLGELRNMQHNRVSCPQQGQLPPSAAHSTTVLSIVGAATLGGPTSRQRVIPAVAQYPRSEDCLEGRSVDQAQSFGGMTQCHGSYRPFFRMDVSTVDVLSDASGRSLESVYVVFEDSEKAPESLKEHCTDAEMPIVVQSTQPSAAVPIPTAPSQLTEALRNMAISPALHQGVARSAPVPVPKHPVAGGPPFLNRRSVCEMSVHEKEVFVPPHLYTDRHNGQDPLKKVGWGGRRGLSSLIARNAVFTQLGYVDGLNEMHNTRQSLHFLADTDAA